MFHALIGLTLLSLLAGCAGQSARRADREPCVPTAVAPLSTWERPLVTSVVMIATNGEPVVGKRVRYETPRGVIQVWWVGPHVVAIDPAVDDETAPALYDAGMATREGYVIINGTPSCRWKTLGAAEARR